MHLTWCLFCLFLALVMETTCPHTHTLVYSAHILTLQQCERADSSVVIILVWWLVAELTCLSVLSESLGWKSEKVSILCGQIAVLANWLKAQWFITDKQCAYLSANSTVHFLTSSYVWDQKVKSLVIFYNLLFVSNYDFCVTLNWTSPFWFSRTCLFMLPALFYSVGCEMPNFLSTSSHPISFVTSISCILLWDTVGLFQWQSQ